jgi:hypothetical protein
MLMLESQRFSKDAHHGVKEAHRANWRLNWSLGSPGFINYHSGVIDFIILEPWKLILELLH